MAGEGTTIRSFGAGMSKVNSAVIHGTVTARVRGAEKCRPLGQVPSFGGDQPFGNATLSWNVDGKARSRSWTYSVDQVTHPPADGVSQSGSASFGSTHQKLRSTASATKRSSGEKDGGVRSHSPGTYARDFKTPTLVIHGELDFRDVTGQGLQLFTALQQQKVPSKLLVFPDEGHWVLKPQNSLLWYHTVLDWIAEWTKK